jgi:MFS family permease
MSGFMTFSRNVVLYLAARFCSASALAMLRAAIAWHVFALSGSAFHLGLIGIAQFLPAFGLSLPGGAVADAIDRRRIVLRAGLAPLAGGLVLSLATQRHAIGLAQLYAVAFLVSGAAAFENPARAALLPSLVTRDELPRVVAAASTNTALALATGPALCGLVIADLGIAAAYAAAASLVCVALLAFLPVRPPAVAQPLRNVGWAAIVDGLRFVRRHRVVLGCMTLDMLAVVFGGAVALLPIYATEILHVGARGYGFLASASDVGAIVCSVLLTTLPPIRRVGPALLGAVALYGLATVAFGLSRCFPLSIAAYMVVGMADQVSVVLRSTTIQLSTPDDLRGRVSSVNMIFIGASNQLGAAESGMLAALTSPTVSVVAGGVASVIVVVAIALAVPELRRYRV